MHGAGGEDAASKCGGGVKIRTRQILREGAFGGMMCGSSVQEIGTCNVASCDRDCELGR